MEEQLNGSLPSFLPSFLRFFSFFFSFTNVKPTEAKGEEEKEKKKESQLVRFGSDWLTGFGGGLVACSFGVSTSSF